MVVGKTRRPQHFITFFGDSPHVPHFTLLPPTCEVFASSCKNKSLVPCTAKLNVSICTCGGHPKAVDPLWKNEGLVLSIANCETKYCELRKQIFELSSVYTANCENIYLVSSKVIPPRRPASSPLCHSSMSPPPDLLLATPPQQCFPTYFREKLLNYCFPKKAQLLGKKLTKCKAEIAFRVIKKKWMLPRYFKECLFLSTEREIESY
jgi:hypothetical protein